ncbi:hypothetical protein D3C83_36240 [compost metagenome]
MQIFRIVVGEHALLIGLEMAQAFPDDSLERRADSHGGVERHRSRFDRRRLLVTRKRVTALGLRAAFGLQWHVLDQRERQLKEPPGWARLQLQFQFA